MNRLRQIITKPTVVLLIAVLAFWANRAMFKIPGSSSFILNDIGITNNINQLRGEDGMTLLARLMHNKSAFLYKYLENSVSVIDSPKITEGFGFVATLLFLIGLFFVVKNKERRGMLLIFYMLTVALVGGLYSQANITTILLIPPVAVLAVYAISKIKPLWLQRILGMVVLVELILKALI
jgi:uncharacterized membrane protein